MRAPMRNLSPMAEPWGRYVDEKIVDLRRVADSVSLDIRNDGSVQNSAMDNMAIQIRELAERQTRALVIPNMRTAPFNETSISPIVSAAYYIPRPSDYRRIGILSIQGIMDVSAPLISAGYVQFMVDGRIIGTEGVGLPYSSSAPPGWEKELSVAYASVLIGPSDPGVLQINLAGRGLFETGTRHVTFSDIRATIQYGQRA